MKTQSSPSLRLLGVLFLIALCVRMVYLFELAATPLFDVVIKGLDHHNFDQAAIHFSNGDWLARSENNNFAPLYKYFLGAIYFIFGRNFYVVYSLQFAMGALASVLVYLIARDLFGNRAGFIAFAGFAFYSTEIIYEGIILRAAFITFFGLLSFYLFSRLQEKFDGKRLILATLALSLFFQARPNTLLCLPFVCLFLSRYVFAPLSFPESKKAWMFFSGTLLLSFAPLLVQCYLVHGKFVFFDASGPMAFIAGNVTSYAGFGFDTGILDRFQQSYSFEYGNVIAFLFQHIVESPLEFILLYLRKFYFFFNDFEAPANVSIYLYREHSRVLPLLLNHFGLYSSLGVIGMFLALRAKKPVFLLTSYTLALLVSVVLFHVVARFRLPIVPYLIIFGSYAVSVAVDHVQRRSFRKPIAISVAFAGLLYFSSDARGARPIRFVDHCNLGFAYMNHERLFDLEKIEENAIRCWDAERKLYGANNLSRELLAATYNFYGYYLTQKGILDEAKDILKFSYSIFPSSPMPYRMLADIAVKENKSKEAVRWLQLGSVSNRDAVELYKYLVHVHHQTRQPAARIWLAMRHWLRLEKDSAVAASLKNELSLLQGEILKRQEAEKSTIREGRSYYLAQQWQQALPHFIRSNEVNRTDATGFLEQGLIHGNLKQYARALEAFYRGLMIDPERPEIHKVLAEYYLSVNQPVRASIHFPGYLREPDDSEEYRRAQKNYRALRHNLGNRKLEKRVASLNPSEKKQVLEWFKASWPGHRSNQQTR